LFVEHLAKEAYERTAQGKRKTVQKKDLGIELTLYKYIDWCFFKIISVDI
jgi:histone H3/H4